MNPTTRLEPLTIPHAADELVVDAVLSPVPDFMGVILANKPAKAYNLRSGQPVDLPLNKPAINMAFRPRTSEANPTNEVAIVTGAESSSVVRLDLELGIGLIDLFMPRATAVAYSHCGRFLAAGSNDGLVRVYNLQDLDRPPAEVFYTKASHNPITRLAFNATNDVLFATTGRGELLWMNPNIPEMGANPYLLDADTSSKPYDWDCYCVATHPVHGLVAFGGHGSKILLTTTDSRKIVTLETQAGPFVRNIEFLPQTGQLLVVGAEVRVLNLDPLGLADAQYSIPVSGKPLSARLYGSSVFVARA